MEAQFSFIPGVSLPTWLSFGLLTFSTFFPIVNPLGNTTIFHTLTEKMTRNDMLYTAKISCLVACLLSIFFAFMGDYIFDLFHLTVNGLKIVGGIIFFITGYDMLRANMNQYSQSKDKKSSKDLAREVAVTPMGIPFLFGPGTLTNSIIIMNDAGESWLLKFGFLLGIAAIFLLTFLCFIGSHTLLKILGPSGNRVILSIMGLFIMILAVQYFFEGLTPIVKNMIQ